MLDRQEGVGGKKKKKSEEKAEGTPRSEEKEEVFQRGADIPKGTVVQGGPVLEQKKSEKEGETDCCILTPALVFLVAVMKGLSEIHGKNKVGEDVSRVKE